MSIISSWAHGPRRAYGAISAASRRRWLRRRRAPSRWCACLSGFPRQRRPEVIRVAHRVDLGELCVEGGPIVRCRDGRPDRFHLIDEHRAGRRALEIGMIEAKVLARLERFERIEERLEALLPV